MTRFLCALAFLLSLMPATGAGAAGTGPAPAAADIFARLGAGGARQASFVEIRRIGELDAPIESRGELRFEPPDTLTKQTISPIEETLQLRGDRLSVEMGETVRELPLSAAPAAAALAAALRGLLAGNLAEVEKAFAVQAEGSDQNWRLRLRPKSADVAASLAAIVVQGQEAQVSQIDLTQTNGDESLMRILGTP